MTGLLKNDIGITSIGGICYDMNTPCVHYNFGHAPIDTLFKTTLPKYIIELGEI